MSVAVYAENREIRIVGSNMLIEQDGQELAVSTSGGNVNITVDPTTVNSLKILDVDNSFGTNRCRLIITGIRTVDLTVPGMYIIVKSTSGWIVDRVSTTRV